MTASFYWVDCGIDRMCAAYALNCVALQEIMTRIHVYQNRVIILL